MVAGLESLECGVEGGDLGAGGDELGGELVELGVEMAAELLNGLLEAVVGGDLLGLADLDRFEVGEDGGEEQVGEGVHRVIHERILMRVGIWRRITGERALVMGGSTRRPFGFVARAFPKGSSRPFGSAEERLAQDDTCILGELNSGHEDVTGL